MEFLDALCTKSVEADDCDVVNKGLFAAVSKSSGTGEPILKFDIFFADARLGAEQTKTRSVYGVDWGQNSVPRRAVIRLPGLGQKGSFFT